MHKWWNWSWLSNGRREINTSLQTEVNKISTECDEKKIKHILQQLQTQRKMASS